MLRHVLAFFLISILGVAAVYGAELTDAPTPVPVAFLICLALFGFALADGIAGRRAADRD